MEKPIGIILKELEDKIIKNINNADLQPFLVRPIIEKIYNQVVVLEQQSFLNKQEKYNKSIEKGEDVSE